MNRLLLISVVTVLVHLFGSAQAATVKASFSSSIRNASPQADSAGNYQSCSQGDQPLFSDFPPKNADDFQTYMHYTAFKDGKVNDILMWGQVDRCDESRLRQVLKLARPVGTISLLSPGGSLDESMAMGRTLREFGATVIVEQGHSCVSACNFIFMGGAIRMVEPGADFEVHMFDDGAADTLQDELSDPPENLVDFIKLFPFRSDETMDEIDADVQSHNTANQKAISELLPINQMLAGEANVGIAQAGASADSRVIPDKAGTSAMHADTASPGPTTSALDASISGKQMEENVATMNNDCAPTLYYGLTGNASLDLQRKYVSVCIGILSKPYTARDWFDDQARTEDVKAIQQDAATAAAEIARYLSEMSISLRFLTDFASIPNAKPRQLSVDEMRDLNIVNAD